MTVRQGPAVLSGPGPYAWRRPIGLPYDGSEQARQDVDLRLIDDGPWGGVPLGGLGAGSIGRTHRGDFARWHLDVGRHRFETVPADQFSVFVARGGAHSAHVLSTIRPETLPAWNWDLPEGAGTYHGLFPNAWFEYDWDELPVRLTQRQFSPVIPGNYRESSYPVGIFEWQIENPGPDPVTVGLMFSWLNDIGRDRGQDRRGGHRNVSVRKDGAAGVLLNGPSDARRRTMERQLRDPGRRGTRRHSVDLRSVSGRRRLGRVGRLCGRRPAWRRRR